MKIEIGESIILSWLKHAKNCQIVQLNWKPSTISWDYKNEEEIDRIIEYTQQHYLDEHQLDLFKKNSSTRQIIQQGEADALGVEICASSIKKLYCVDVAFHESGLNYGSKDVTIAKVLQKLIRSAVTILGYFDMRDGDIIFASPKINNSIIAELNWIIPELNKDFNEKWRCNYNFSVICNERFKERMFDVVTTLSKDVADTSELFMRSIQLFNLFNQEKRTSNVKSTEKVKRKLNKSKDSQMLSVSGYEEIKIGALVRRTLPELIENGAVTEKQLADLQNPTYSKDIFDINYSIIKKIDPAISNKENRNVAGYPRYYAFTVKAEKEEYLITSEWFDRNKKHYIKWLKKYIKFTY